MPIDLHKELTELRRTILTMGSLVEQRVEQAIDALLRGELDEARSVRLGDRDIDEMDVDIEAECLRVLALSQPVAADLRFVLAALRINGELERIGDQAKSIAKRVIDLGQAGPVEVPVTLREMAAASRKMLSDALTALSEEDPRLCRQVLAADDQVDAYQKQIFAWVQEEIPRHVDGTRAVIDLLSVAQRLERIADLATNIAENVIFLVEGSQVRHAKV
ncbi:MAG: phosphate signaling complex protein PhoU [Planctomycetota bacterium]